jgi:hypothetical protein
MHPHWEFLVVLLVMAFFVFIIGLLALQFEKRAVRKITEKHMAKNEAFKIAATPQIIVTDDDIKSMREWLDSWGDGPNWMDKTGVSVPIVKSTLKALLDDRDSWKRRAKAHGCNTEEGDPDCG